MKLAHNAQKLKDSATFATRSMGYQPPRLQSVLALETAANGIPVHPVSDVTKHPLTLHGRNDATTDQSAIREWWRRHPHALVSIPTGPASGVVVLDIDRGGESAFNGLLAKLQCETIDDLSPCWARTPGDGLHVYFQFEPDTAPRTRSSDIAERIDTRGLGGSIIIPGNVRQNGRAYEWGNPSASLYDAPTMPRWLLYLMTFNARERSLIASTPALLSQMKDAPATEWYDLLQQWRDHEAAKVAARTIASADDDDGMRRQALHDLRTVVTEFATLTDGRRQRLFSLACRVARYVVHGVISEGEFIAAFKDAASANGAITKHGATWATHTLRSALVYSRGDKLPPLARAFRSEVRT